MRRPWSTAVAFATVSLFAACSSSSEPTRFGDVDAPARSHEVLVRDAAEATLEEGTATARISGLTQPGFVDGSASMDMRRPRAYLELEAEIGIDSTVAVDGVDLYFDSNFFSQGTKSSRPWIKTTADELVEILGSEGLGLAESAEHPALLLHALAGIEGADEAGTEELAGAKVTRYDATVDLREAARIASGEWREQILDYATRLDSLGASDVLELGVWIDADGLVRKVDEAYEYDDEAFALPGRTGGSVGPLHLTFEYEDFGVTPKLDVPRPGEVEALDEYWERLLSEAGLDS
jgi:hypothetical protein